MLAESDFPSTYEKMLINVFGKCMSEMFTYNIPNFFFLTKISDLAVKYSLVETIAILNFLWLCLLPDTGSTWLQLGKDRET